MNVVYHHRTRGRGAEGVHIMGVVDAMRAEGHKVKIVSLPGSDPEVVDSKGAVNDDCVEKSPVRRLLELTKKLPEVFFEIIELAYNFFAYFKVSAALKEHKAGLLYERYSLFMFGGVLAARRNGISVVLEINDSAIVERVRPLFFRFLARKFESWIFRKCDGLVFISREFEHKVKQEYNHIAPSVVCPNGVNLSHFSSSSLIRSDLRNRLGLKDKVVCGYVGAFVHWHGIDGFIEEIAPILNTHKNLALLLVGDGVAFPSISEQVDKYKLHEQVILPGRVAHSEVAGYISAMDFGILPDSNDYGSPMKLFEMMAMSVALVCPAYGPILEVVEDNTNGWLFPPKNLREAVDKVIRLSEEPSILSEVGNNARLYIENNRQWKHNVELTMSLLSPR